MDKTARNRFHRIWKEAQSDPEYARLCGENRILEKLYFSVLDSLPPEKQDTVQDFVMNCEGMSWRMLDFACENMRFPEET